MPAEVNSLPIAYTQVGKRAPGITQLHDCYEGKFYSGPIFMQPDTHVRALHCNGLHSNPPEGAHDIIYMMTCSPLSSPED